MSARALEALSQLDPLTQLVVGQVYGFTGNGPKSANLVSAEMGLTPDEVARMLDEGLRALAGYKKKVCAEHLAAESEKKTSPYDKPSLKLVKSDLSGDIFESNKLKLAKG